mmetsp:Transcript_18043/g.41738  ORF Transcript_18043/g.41738 Transcript_18043/m.41738 type:complete len:165 (-) Transcript_18043:124-618(-)
MPEITSLGRTSPTNNESYHEDWVEVASTTANIANDDDGRRNSDIPIVWACTVKTREEATVTTITTASTATTILGTRGAPNTQQDEESSSSTSTLVVEGVDVETHSALLVRALRVFGFLVLFVSIFALILKMLGSRDYGDDDVDYNDNTTSIPTTFPPTLRPVHQ